MERFNIRKLQKEDYNNGFLQLLEQLTVVNPKDITYDIFCDQFDKVINEVYVVEDLDQSGKLVASGSVLIEPKFIRNLGSVGHIEDIVVDKQMRGHGLGKLIVLHLVQVAQEKGCYKVILDCSEDNYGFYDKCEFIKKGLEMAKYF